MNEKESKSQQEEQWRGWASETISFSNKGTKSWKIVAIISITYNFLVTMTILLGLIYFITNFNMSLVSADQDGQSNYNVVDSTGVDFGADSTVP